MARKFYSTRLWPMDAMSVIVMSDVGTMPVASHVGRGCHVNGQHHQRFLRDAGAGLLTFCWLYRHLVL